MKVDLLMIACKAIRTGAQKNFLDEQSCVDYLRNARWGERVSCPNCGGLRIYHFSDGRTFKCGGCLKRFSVKVGTIFEASNLPLHKWFLAVDAIVRSSSEISSAQLAKTIDVTQKTAWFMLRRLRCAAMTKSFNAPIEMNTVNLQDKSNER
jgi:transposase-like protein